MRARSGTDFALQAPTSPSRHRLRPRRGRGSSVRVCFGFPVFVLSCVRAFLRDWWERRAGARCSAANRGSVHRWGNRRLPASQDPSWSPPNAFGGETQGLVFRLTCGTKSSPSQGETERVFAARGRRSSSGERRRRSSNAKSVSVREECVYEGVVARHRSLHERGQRPWSLLVLMPPFRPSSARSLASTKPRQHEASPHAHERSPRCAAGDHPTAIPPQRSGGDGRLPNLREAFRRCSPGRETAAPGALSRAIRAAAGPPLALHRERPGRGIGARTRPGTPVVFFFWSTWDRGALRQEVPNTEKHQTEKPRSRYRHFENETV